MKSIRDIRRDNLIYIIEKYYDGKQRRLAEALECAPNVISRYLSSSDLKSHRDISDHTARKIEYLTRTPKYWMDKDHLNDVMEDNSERALTDTSKILSDNITTLMMVDGIKSQTKLSIKSGLGQSTINRIIKNEASATIDSLEAIANALGRKPYELLIPPNDKDILQYDHKKYAELPWSEKEKINDFIEFIINKYQK
ncbi:helix-turn-helix transcriptional regulator [Arsenophonus sp. aPb]|uniref:helix-turn-helix domain-containing protein n=1 Tax=Arsenophonus sp. aPb TaxID=3041619 RepID=UPI002468DCF0|nr:helix-turn-helix transcriptional regulator [Arsenophonus sp. aPb]WGL97373.1 helix-turn-helix transcriptional regulator [Arsenophonus sp. aPb]